jgi:hypothetical protein
MTNFHETYREHDVAKASSARTFGLLMGAAFVLLALRSYVKGGGAWTWLLGAAIAFALVALARPTALAPLNRIWMALGMVLNRVMSPIVLALLFVLVVTPVGLLMRITGKDPLRLKRAAAGGSYWLAHEPLEHDHFTRQF